MDPWNKVLAIIKEQVSPVNYRAWFAKTKAIQINGTITVATTSSFAKQTILVKYLPIVEAAVFEVYRKKIDLEFKVESSLSNLSGKVQEEETVLKMQPSAPIAQTYPSLNPKYTLDNFVVGLSNNMAFAAAQAVAANPGITYNPLFIYGGTGVGKTHLMHGIGNTLIKKDPSLKILYCSSERFMNDLIESIRNKRTNEFRHKYRSLDLLLIDDIQFISGRDSTQEEFFHTFNELQVKNSQIILTSDRPPNDIQKLESRLQSRFQGGLMVDIQMPDFDTRVAILRAKCQERGEVIEESCLTLIAENMPTNARELEGKLIQIIQTAKLGGKNIDQEYINHTIGVQAQPKQAIDQKKVISGVTSYFNLKASDINGPKRNRGFVVPRQIIMFFLYQECKIPFEKIGELLGGRDHTTIMHGVDKIRQAITRDREIQKIIIEIKQKISP